MRLMTNTVGVALVTILCLACTGCELLALSLGAPEEIRQAAGAAQCDGNACDSANWLLVNADAGVFVSGGSGACGRRYEVDIPAGRLEDQSVSANLRDAPLLAIVASGVVYLVPFGQAAPTKSSDLQAVAASWSNAGDRLAVATLNPETDAAALLILDDQLNELDRFEITLSLGEGGVSGVQQAFVSWNSSDTHIAATALTSSEGALVNVESRVVRPIAVRALQFVGDRDAVANDADGAFVRAYRLADDDLQGGNVVSNALHAVASDPVGGVFVTVEPAVLGRLPPGGRELGLNTLAVGPAVFNATFGPVTIIPQELARHKVSGLCEP